MTLTISRDDLVSDSVSNEELFLCETPLIENIQHCLDKLPAYTKKSVHASLVATSSLYFVRCICNSELPISRDTLTSYIKLIETSVQKGTEAVQQASSLALGAVSHRIDLSIYLTEWLPHLRHKTNFTARRGWTMALGHIELQSYITLLLALCESILSEKDIEAKRNAIQSVGLIFSRLTYWEDPAIVTRIWSTLTDCLDDYTVDQRGDVGSWIRIAACEALVPLMKFSSQENVEKTIGKILRLCVEKMDRVRTVAGRTLCAIVPQWPVSEESLLEFVGTAKQTGDELFSTPSKVYSSMASLLSLECYRKEMLTGFLISAGGLGESLVPTSSLYQIDVDSDCFDCLGRLS